MFNDLFKLSLTTMSIWEVLLCTLISLLLGLIIALCYMKSGKYSKNFVVSVVILPALVQMVIMLVNGDVGTSVAILGVFSLVRFRSFPGTAKEITVIFFTVATGLAVGMGYAPIGAAMTVLLCVALLILSRSRFGENKAETKQLRITIPENLDYEGIFDDIFEKYTKECTLDRVKTTNLGTMFDLTYSVVFKAGVSEKSFIDEIRCRNGNLPVVCGRPKTNEVEL